ncbi:MAG: hypothetical protein AAGA65_31110, partial [Actinomycetota bacterium]
MTTHAHDDNPASPGPVSSDEPEAEVRRIEAEVDRLCSEYSTADAEQLLTESRRSLDELATVLDRAWSGPHQRRLLEQVGWLHLLNA